jgi:hypothetical protein
MTKMKCVIADCSRRATTRGMCHGHYVAWWRREKKSRGLVSTTAATPRELRTATREDVEQIWFWRSAGVPLDQLAAGFSLRITGELVDALRSRADAEGVDLEAEDRAYREMVAKGAA